MMDPTKRALNRQRTDSALRTGLRNSRGSLSLPDTADEPEQPESPPKKPEPAEGEEEEEGPPDTTGLSPEEAAQKRREAVARRQASRKASMK